MEALGRAEPPHAHSRVLHEGNEVAFDRPRPEPVEKDTYPNTLPGTVGQEMGELGADAAAPVDVGEEVDGVAGMPDGIEERWEDLVAVAEDVDAVAFRRRDTEHAFEGAS